MYWNLKKTMLSIFNFKFSHLILDEDCLMGWHFQWWNILSQKEKVFPIISLHQKTYKENHHSIFFPNLRDMANKPKKFQ